MSTVWLSWDHGKAPANQSNTFKSLIWSAGAFVPSDVGKLLTLLCSSVHHRFRWSGPTPARVCPTAPTILCRIHTALRSTRTSCLLRLCKPTCSWVCCSICLQAFESSQFIASGHQTTLLRFMAPNADVVTAAIREPQSIIIFERFARFVEQLCHTFLSWYSRSNAGRGVAQDLRKLWYVPKSWSKQKRKEKLRVNKFSGIAFRFFENVHLSRGLPQTWVIKPSLLYCAMEALWYLGKPCLQKSSSSSLYFSLEKVMVADWRGSFRRHVPKYDLRSIIDVMRESEASNRLCHTGLWN